MNIEESIAVYRQSDKVKTIAENLAVYAEPRMFLKGLSGSVDAFVASAVTFATEQLHVFILADREEAAYFLNNLEQMIGRDKVLFFPMSHRRPYETEEVDNSNIQQRAETLNRINSGRRSRAVITYPEALSEKVITRKNLSKNTLRLSTGEKVSIDFLIEMLFEFEFERVDYVYEPGQFAVRGGIVDIFSFAYEKPIRIELFGDEVESLRTFEPTTQLSVKSHQSVTIIPNVQEHLLKETRESFLDFLPEKATVWLKDLDITCDLLDREFEIAEKAYAQTNKDLNYLKPEQKFVHADALKHSLEKFAIIEFGQRTYFEKSEEILFRTAPQPSFNKNFELLAKNFRENSKSHYENIIAADNSKQIERIHAIFEDIHFKQEENQKLDFSPLLVSLSEGFIDHDNKLAVYTDHQIFERYHRFRLR